MRRFDCVCTMFIVNVYGYQRLLWRLRQTTLPLQHERMYDWMRTIGIIRGQLLQTTMIFQSENVKIRVFCYFAIVSEQDKVLLSKGLHSKEDKIPPISAIDLFFCTTRESGKKITRGKDSLKSKWPEICWKSCGTREKSNNIHYSSIVYSFFIGIPLKSCQSK